MFDKKRIYLLEQEEVILRIIHILCVIRYSNKNICVFIHLYMCVLAVRFARTKCTCTLYSSLLHVVLFDVLLRFAIFL